MITFEPKPVPLWSAIKMLFTRTCYLAIVYDELGNPKRAGICYDKPVGADPYGDEEKEEMARAVEQAREALNLGQRPQPPAVPFTGHDIRPKEPITAVDFSEMEDRVMAAIYGPDLQYTETGRIWAGGSPDPIHKTIREIAERNAPVMGVSTEELEGGMKAAIARPPEPMPQFSTRYVPVERKKNRKERRQERRKK